MQASTRCRGVPGHRNCSHGTDALDRSRWGREGPAQGVRWGVRPQSVWGPATAEKRVVHSGRHFCMLDGTRSTGRYGNWSKGEGGLGVSKRDRFTMLAFLN